VASRTFRTDAIVLRTVDFAETSQVVHLATPDRGLVAAIAKGGHGAKGAFQGGVPLGVLGEAEVVPRRGGDLDVLRSFRVTDGLRGLHEDLDRYAAGTYVLSLLRDLVKPDLEATAIFRAGATALRALAASPPAAAPTWTVVFEARALAAAGHRPHLSSCVVCSDELDARSTFSPAAGGLAHVRCAPPGARVPVDTPAVAALRRLYAARLPELAAEPPSPRELRAVRAVHDLFVPWVLDREPRGLRTVPGR
jgi:DNA repair protein RecO (recombination protein O)